VPRQKSPLPLKMPKMLVLSPVLLKGSGNIESIATQAVLGQKTNRKTTL
jgi:cation transporter-like permease